MPSVPFCGQSVCLAVNSLPQSPHLYTSSRYSVTFTGTYDIYVQVQDGSGANFQSSVLSENVSGTLVHHVINWAFVVYNVSIVAGSFIFFVRRVYFSKLKQMYHDFSSSFISHRNHP